MLFVQFLFAALSIVAAPAPDDAARCCAAFRGCCGKMSGPQVSEFMAEMSRLNAE